MNKHTFAIFLFFLSIVIGVFFYKAILQHQVPFPGDLLMSITPFKTESYFGYGPGGYPNKAQGPDVIYEIYPWRYFSIQEIVKGNIPFWNPHNFSGNQQLGNYQTALFYPLNIVYLFLSFPIAWTVIIISEPFLAGVFMYLFLKDLKIGSFSAGLAAVGFSFSSYMVVWLEYGNIGSTLLWLPLVLVFIKRFVATEQKKYAAFSVIVLFCAFLAGYVQGVFYIYLFAFAYLCFLLIRGKKRITGFFFLSIIMMFLLPILLAAFQILPTISLFTDSTRSNYSLAQIHQLLQPFFYWITIFVPDFFGNPASRNMWVPLTYIERVMYPGVPFLFFALLALSKTKESERLFFAFVGGLVLLITTDFPAVAYLYQIPIPLFSTTVPTRMLSIFIFCTLVLGASGIDEWIRDKKKQTILLPVLFIGFYGILWCIIFIFPKLNPSLTGGFIIAKRNLILPTILAVTTGGIYLLKRKLPILSQLVLGIVVIADLLYFFSKITPFSPSQLLYPKTAVMEFIKNTGGINRYWGYGDAYIPPNFDSVFKTYSPEGNDPLHIRSYTILLSSSKNGQYPRILPRPDANVAPGYGANNLRENTFRQTLLNVLGVKYVLNLDETLPDTPTAVTGTFDPNTYQLIWQKNPWQVYENKKALPRFFIASDFIVIKNPIKALKAFYSIDLSKTIILDQNPIEPIGNPTLRNASLVSYEANDVKINTHTNKPALLFLSDNYYPSWHAVVDGKETRIYKADFTFRAVSIPSGSHKVTFYYSHPEFNKGLALAGVGIILLFIYSFMIPYYREKE